MDTRPADLLTAWWESGDKDSARVLADRLAELDSATVAEALVEFRTAALAAPADEASRLGLAAVRAFLKAFAEALGQLPHEAENFPA